MTARTSTAIVLIGATVVGAGLLALTTGPADEAGQPAGTAQRFVELPPGPQASSGPPGSAMATPVPLASPNGGAGLSQAPAPAEVPVEDPYAG